MKHITIILLGLLTSGCGVSAILQCGGDSSCVHGLFGVASATSNRLGESTSNLNDTNNVSGVEIAGIGSTTENLFFDATSSDPAISAVSAFDPFLLSIFGLEDYPELLSLHFDNLLIDSLSTTGSSSMTFLERLCIAGGDPEFLCRRRYGR